LLGGVHCGPLIAAAVKISRALNPVAEEKEFGQKACFKRHCEKLIAIN